MTDDADLVRALRTALRDNKRLRAEARRHNEPIAVVAVGCRFPGGVTSPDEFWALLAKGGDAVEPFPGDRGWAVTAAGGITEGGFLTGAGDFDPGFFGISPREARSMDPQQRLLLEVAWETLENAGIDPSRLRGSRTGVFTGTNGQDYGALAQGDPGAEGYLITGNAASVVSGRVSYTLGFEGPSITVDTACSASLVALHLAAQSLRLGECDLALAGGATVMATPTAFVEFARQGGLAPDGRCKAFADGADGTAWGEGVGLVLLERLSDAHRNGHPVMALLRGSAVNQDGASNGLTAPNGRAQQRVIRDALANAGIGPGDVDAVEAHGTGTALGDPIEAEALIEVFGRDRDRPLWLGSVKSNIGHTQAAAGIGGVIKMILALRHGTLPRTLHAEEPSRHVDWSAGAVRLLTEAVPWPGHGRPRRAGVSSFGVSGTNAHVVIEEPPERDAGPPARDSAGPVPWLLSGRSEPALRAQAARLLAALDGRAEVPGPDIAYTLATGRAAHPERAVVLGRDAGEWAEGLAAVAAGRPSPGVLRGVAGRHRTAFLFTGQGGQRAGMGRDLAAAFPVFADAWDETLTRLDGDEVRVAGNDTLARTDLAQKGLFAFEVAMCRLWQSWGVRPDYLLGHSIGELAAAHVAGVMSLADACRLVAARGRLMRALPAGGAMLAVEASEQEVAGLPVAAVNGPGSVVISGPEALIEECAAQWRARGRRVRRLNVSHAFHSAAMDPMLAEFGEVAAGIRYERPDIAVVSNVTGQLLREFDAGYWVRHARQTVRFGDGLHLLTGRGVSAFLEVGPEGVLCGQGRDGLFVPSSRGDRDEVATVMTALSRLHTAGVEADWTRVLDPRPPVPLPTYPFQRDRYWLTPAPVRSPDAGRHYQVTWVAVPGDAPARLDGVWLIAAPGPEAYELVARVLTEAGADVRPYEPGIPARGVVSLLDAAGTNDLAAGLDAPLWMVTGDAVADPEQAQRWGLGRVVGLEHPGRWGGLVDVADGALDRLPAVLAAPGDEDQFALGPDGTRVRRLNRVPVEADGPAWTPRGTVLVTGGTGALGGHVARWLAANGAAHLVLTSRSGLAAEGAGALRDDLTAQGVTVTVAAGDVTDPAFLGALLAEHPPTAVIHTAGTSRPAPVGDPAALADVHGAKTRGADLLDELLDGVPLDAFVLFSSVAGVWGSAGQAGYAAANAHLDALAERRHARGLAATSIAWGPWAGGGMAAGAEQLLRRGGLTPMAPAAALEALRRAVGSGAATRVVADVDWERFAASYTLARPRPLITDLVPAPAAPPAAPRLDRPALDVVREHVAAVLQMPTPAAVTPDRPLRELGLESLTAVELRDALAAATGLRLPATVVFDHPTAAALAHHLEAELAGGGQPAPAPAAAVVEDGDPIVIVSTGCRFPGRVRSSADLWRLVAAGADAIGPFPTDRGWDLDNLYHPDPDHAGTSYASEGGFLEGADRFDAALFGINPREALAMDPQQRLLLETSWEVFERAGMDPTAQSGAPIGVFVGAAGQGYGADLTELPDGVAGYLLTGNATSIISGRLAYTYGLEGPALTLDTACSSSLVALHLAARSLRAGECEQALVGGVMVMPTPLPFVEFSRQRGLAPDGRCKPFAAAADGTGWSEGAGMVLLERLSTARRLGHPVLARLRGSAVNQDGASNGLTAPSGPAQQRVIRQALANAGLAPREVDAVEAHGTGTRLGDPIEAQALLATYGRDRDTDRPLWLGSVKSNIGHTQAASGMAGLLKMVEAMRQGVLPATLHVDRPTPHVDWAAGAVRLLTEAVDWPDTGRPRRAAVSSFGASGTNAHVILEAVAEPEPVPASASTGPLPWVFSARTGEALRAQAARLADEIGEPTVDHAYSLATTRAHLPHRAVLVTGEPGRVPSALRAVAGDEAADGVVRGTVLDNANRPVFVFPGQGSQWPGMAVDLLDTAPVFAARMRECAAALAPYVEWSLLDVLRGEAGAPSMTRTDVVQPLLFAVMLSLAELWRAHGVEPAAVIGHSQGEIAAACVAGVLPLSDAARMVARRSQALMGLSGAGAMGSVLMPHDELIARLPRWNGRVGVAAVNGPSSVIVSGDADAVEALLGQLAGEGVRTRRIQADGAGHSAHLEPLRPRLEAAFDGIVPRAATAEFYSTVTGERIDTAELDPGYWWRNVRDTVRFEPAATALMAAGHTVFLEMSPHPTLTLGLQATASAAGHEIAVCGSLRRDEGGRQRFLTSIGEAYTYGVEVDWTNAFAGRGARRTALPTYAFQGRRYWLTAGPAGHPMLSAAVTAATTGDQVFPGRLSPRDLPWLADHAVRGTVLVPGTALLEMAQHAAHESGCDLVEELVLRAPLVPATDLRIQVVVGPAGPGGERPLSLHSQAAGDAEWTTHATGTVRPGHEAPRFDLSVWPPADAEPVPIDGLYDRLAATGQEYGPAFQGLHGVWRRDDEIFAEVRAGDSDTARYGLHPALLDAALHAVAAVETTGPPRLPFAWAGARLYASGAAALRVRLVLSPSGEIAVQAADEGGRPVAAIDALTTREITPALSAARPRPDALHRVDWVARPLTGERPDEPWALGDDDLGAGAALFSDGVRLAADNDPDPTVTVVAVGSPVTGPEVAATHDAVHRMFGIVRSALPTGSHLVVVTRGAVAVGDRAATDLAYAPVWGLLRSAQTENPGRITMVDVDGDAPAGLAAVVTGARAAGESQVALRDGVAYVPRLVPHTAPGVLEPPPGAAAWRVEVAGTDGTGVDDLVLGPAPEAEAPLAAGQVRVAVQAAGVNFRDVLITLGMYPERSRLGGEGAGIVLETGPDTPGLRPGDRVFGLFAECGAFGPVAVTDHRVLAPIPDGWSFTEAATAPVAYLTAYLGLVELAGLRAGESVLIHAATGGVGTAAVRIAEHLGARVYATAGPAKWPALRAAGLPPERIASSRDLAFEESLRQATGGRGVDVVLNSLAGEFVDASLRLLPRGGRFLEMGKTDLRDPAAVPAGITYRAFDLNEFGPDRLGAILRTLLGWFSGGALPPLPLRRWDVRRAPAALRHVSQARHIGKVVLTVPALDPDGTALVTGATGTLGRLLARHLVTAHGVRKLLLLSRRGIAPGLVEELTALGAEVTLRACDVADRAALAAVLADHPVHAVFHTAGVLDDGLAVAQTPEQIERVLRPKVDGAVHLHELTGELRAFVLFSAASGVLGGPGQANYAAANTFLDALAGHRRSLGLCGTSLAWGLWAPESGMAELSAADRRRMARGGVLPIAADHGVALLDAALIRDEPLLAPVRFDRPALRAQGPALPPLLRGLVGASARRRVDQGGGAAPDGGATLRRRLSGLPPAEREAEMLSLVRVQAATALGHDDPEAVTAAGAFLELGFDSLTAVELRNRLSAATGLRLAPALVFDHPTPAALAGFLLAELRPEDAAASPAPTGGDRATGLWPLFQAAVRTGRVPQFVASLRPLADFRSTFTGDTTGISGPVRLARGGAPALVCLPPMVGRSGPHQYARFAAGLRDRRDVSVLPHPGFRSGEPLPADREALVRAHAEATLGLAAGRPFVLAGYSSGGLVAHAVAAELERRGEPPQAVVLLDTYRPDAGERFDELIPRVLDGLLARQTRMAGDGAEAGGDAWLTAMARYLQFDWTPATLGVPVLLVQAADPMPGTTGDGWRAGWPGAGTTLTVRGDHFTMLETHAAGTAGAVHEWLSQRGGTQ
ncbi:SDR family NAD(P)-dependent oxidoreductase [Actinoplanes sp. LDG1-06]|uniref:SDR family NAD(P)-dependent oxidoreductase n=1 Tax=Paractinoplanes ovalisporus TaxID=2810368 RepID=A0ABS2AWS8_9ACTN|nr:type I polyketide synthase [Actinoplanes ovalisporus]MBM2623629.1 SDR family NAD(P)-dependent oxidoreductase [Actinoplanes ovalisporus]